LQLVYLLQFLNMGVLGVRAVTWLAVVLLSFLSTITLHVTLLDDLFTAFDRICFGVSGVSRVFFDQFVSLDVCFFVTNVTPFVQGVF